VELSVNYSEELSELIRAGEVRVDRIKCADWPDMIAAATQLGRVYVHFPLHAGTDGGERPDFQRVDAMARQPGNTNRIQTAMILGLAFIESLVLFVFVIAVILLFVKS